MSYFSNCWVTHLPKSTLLFLCSWLLLHRDASLLHLSICCSGPLWYAHTPATCLQQPPATLSILFQQSSSRVCTQPWVLLSPILPMMLSARAPALTPQWEQHESRENNSKRQGPGLCSGCLPRMYPGGYISEPPEIFFFVSVQRPSIIVPDQDWEGLHSTFHVCSLVVLQFKERKVREGWTGVNRRQDP